MLRESSVSLLDVQNVLLPECLLTGTAQSLLSLSLVLEEDVLQTGAAEEVAA